MKKLLSVLFVLVVSICMVSAANAVTLAWDFTQPTEADAQATGFRLYSSTDGTNYSPVTDIVEAERTVDVSAPSTDNTRVYYRITAFNGVGESEKSAPCSYYWSTGGGGWVGPAIPGSLRVLDCSKNPTDSQCP